MLEFLQFGFKLQPADSYCKFFNFHNNDILIYYLVQCYEKTIQVINGRINV